MKKMGPLTTGHPLVQDAESCPGCHKPFQVGDYVTLVTIGPGDDPENQERARTDRAYSAAAVPAHWTCVTGEVS